MGLSITQTPPETLSAFTPAVLKWVSTDTTPASFYDVKVYYQDKSHTLQTLTFKAYSINGEYFFDLSSVIKYVFNFPQDKPIYERELFVPVYVRLINGDTTGEEYSTQFYFNKSSFGMKLTNPTITREDVTDYPPFLLKEYQSIASVTPAGLIQFADGEVLVVTIAAGLVQLQTYKMTFDETGLSWATSSNLTATSLVAANDEDVEGCMVYPGVCVLGARDPLTVTFGSVVTRPGGEGTDLVLGPTFTLDDGDINAFSLVRLDDWTALSLSTPTKAFRIDVDPVTLTASTTGGYGDLPTVESGTLSLGDHDSAYVAPFVFAVASAVQDRIFLYSMDPSTGYSGSGATSIDPQIQIVNEVPISGVTAPGLSELAENTVIFNDKFESTYALYRLSPKGLEAVSSIVSLSGSNFPLALMAKSKEGIAGTLSSDDFLNGVTYDVPTTLDPEVVYLSWLDSEGDYSYAVFNCKYGIGRKSSRSSSVELFNSNPYGDSNQSRTFDSGVIYNRNYAITKQVPIELVPSMRDLESSYEVYLFLSDAVSLTGETNSSWVKGFITKFTMEESQGATGAYVAAEFSFQDTYTVNYL